MKFLHLNYSDSKGGAAIAAVRHHDAMLAADMDSEMLVIEHRRHYPHIDRHFRFKETRAFLRIPHKIFKWIHRPYGIWSSNMHGFDLSNDPKVKEADVIILHWVNFYMMSIKSIEKILKTGKPVYWFMHDMWPITGGCHHAFDCLKYMTHCGNCPYLRNHKGSGKEKDLSWRQFEEKLKRLSPYSNLHILTPSNWLASKTTESALFKAHSVEVVRNILDTNIFKPKDKVGARRRLGLPEDKKLILFGANNLQSVYKGWNLLKEALSLPIDGAEGVIYGGSCPETLQAELGIKITNMGNISDLDHLIDLYSACDVLVSPSLADNYPNVIVEAHACGLPVVGTNVGGIPEMIREGVDGRIVEPNGKSIREGILSVLDSRQMSSPDIVRDRVLKENGNEAGLVDFFKYKYNLC